MHIDNIKLVVVFIYTTIERGHYLKLPKKIVCTLKWEHAMPIVGIQLGIFIFHMDIFHFIFNYELNKYLR